MAVFRHPLSDRCDRARAWISLELDGELSEIERALLDAHVGRCDPCAAFRAGATSSTSVLREAPLELLGHPVSLPARRRRLSLGPARAAAAAAAVVAAVGLGTALGLQGSRPSGLSVQVPADLASVSGDQELREIQRLRLRATTTSLLRIVPRGLALTSSQH